MNYVFYVGDTETSGLDPVKNDIIELSLYRLGDDSSEAQKTWCLKPINVDNIDPVALRVNGHKLDDLLWKTKEGREKYLEPSKVLIDIENWMANDGFPAEKRFLIGHSVSFDKNMMEQLWIKCNSKDSFPFGRRSLDTMGIELFLDYCKGQFAEGYSLNNLNKKYGVTNTKAHTAAADVLATKQVFEKQVDLFKKLINR